MSTLYFDCFSGASGDMVLGALLDAGVALEDVRRALGSLAIAPDTIWTERVVRAGVSATKFRVRGEDERQALAHDHEQGHDRGPGHLGHAHPHTHAHETVHHSHVYPTRTLDEIHRLIDGSALSADARDRAKGLFTRLGEAEAAVHGTTLDQVHLHEVGQLDSIIDICGAVVAMECLRPSRVVASPLNVGGGVARTAHGVYPVPAPATARLLAGTPIYAGPQKVELVTPTGALLITEFAGSFGPVPPMRLRATGYGAGRRDFADTPNVLRVLIGDEEASGSQAVVVIEAEIDDMNPQIFGVVMDRLFAAGALDVYYTPIQMKKNRPGTLLTIVAAPASREPLTAIVFRETTTIGVRYREMHREVLDRESRTVTTPFGDVRIKVARRGGEILNASPEFEDCAALAARSGRALKDVQAAAMKAYLESDS